MTYRTFTILGNSKKQNCTCKSSGYTTHYNKHANNIIYIDCINPTALFYLISWPDEDNTMSVVPGHKIISPSVEERVPGSFCKIKRFEKHLSKIEATGTEAEMNKRLNKEANSESDAETEPPKKRARKENKENQTMPKRRKGIQKKTANKKGKYEHVHVSLLVSTCKQVLGEVY